MHFAFIPSDKKDIIRKPQILCAIQLGCKMIKIFEVKIKQPRADIVSECQPFFISQKCTHESEPFFIAYSSLKLVHQYFNID